MLKLSAIVKRKPLSLRRLCSDLSLSTQMASKKKLATNMVQINAPQEQRITSKKYYRQAEHRYVVYIRFIHMRRMKRLM